MTDYILSSSNLNEIQNHDDYEVIWFGSRNYVPRELKQFTDFINQCYTFEECDNFIQKIQSDRKILLVFTDFFQYLSYFNNLRQVQSMYILKKNSGVKEYAKHHYSKLVNVFTNERELIERIRQDILLTYRNDLPVTISCVTEMKIEQTLINFNTNTLLFLWNQFFTYFLVNSPDINMDQLKKTMMEQCRFEYRDNPAQLKIIDKFDETITSGNVLNWYTRDSFLYFLNNKAFRTRNIDSICQFRYFTILLYQKLEDLSKNQKGQNPPTVYRGQMMKINEIKALKSNIGHLISINTFMSTSCREDVARIFIADVKIGVLFKINIPNAHEHMLYPFADISRFSAKLDEDEILFSPGTVLHIDSVEEENDSTWIIQFTLTNETVKQIEQIIKAVKNYIPLVQYFRVILEKTDDYSLFNRYHKYLTNRSFYYDEIAKFVTNLDLFQLISISGNPEKMIEYYQQLLNKEFIDQPKSIVLNVIIGNNYFHLQQFDEALVYYTIALSLLVELVDNKNRLAGEIHHNIGNTYKEQNDFENALLSYKEALEVITGPYASDKTLPGICRKIADLYRKENNAEDAMIYEEQAKQIEEYIEKKSVFIDDETLLRIREHQPDIDCYRPILEHANKLYINGKHLLKEFQFSEASKQLLEAEKIFLKHLPFCDLVVHKLIKIYEHVAFIYLCSNDCFNALTMWRRAINIRTSFNYL